MAHPWILRLETSEGMKDVEIVLGKSYTRQVGVKHNVINASNHEIAFIEVELR